MAKYYGVLPSIVLERATTFDMMVYDVSLAWEADMQRKARGESTVPDLSQDELMKILKESRGEA